jgi:spermidine synthase
MPAGGYWAAMLPDNCPRRALLVGLGGGTVAQLLSRRCPDAAMVGIEHDETVLATARAEFGLDDVPGLTVVLADAFAWIPAAAEREPCAYDFICLDLFYAGRLAPGTLATTFLRQVAALLAPTGTLAVNLMITARAPEQIHRLERVFRPLRTVRVRGNVVVHLGV